MDSQLPSKVCPVLVTEAGHTIQEIKKSKQKGFVEGIALANVVHAFFVA